MLPKRLLKRLLAATIDAFELQLLMASHSKCAQLAIATTIQRSAPTFRRQNDPMAARITQRNL